MYHNLAGAHNLTKLFDRVPRLIVSAILLAGMYPVLSQANPPIDETEVKQTLGAYGDWTAYRLEDGGLEVCYAVTMINLIRGADPALSAVRLQVSNRAFNPGTNLIRFTSPHVLPPGLYLMEYARGLISSVGLTYLLEPWSASIHDEVVDSMMKSRDEVTVLLTQLPQRWEDKDVSLLGGYYTEGFIEAYEAISRACPRRPERPAGTVDQPVRIEGYSMIEGPPLYFQFSLIGPFFEAGKADKLTIRGFPSGAAEFDDMYGERLGEYSPEQHFHFDTDRLEFYRNGEYADSFRSNFRTDINGVCLSTESGRLKLLVESWSGGASTPASKQSYFYEPGEGIFFDDHYAIDDPGPNLVECLDNETRWKEGEPFLPCRCTGSAGNELYRSTMKQLRSDIWRAASAKEDSMARTIGDDAFSALLSRIARLEPFIWFDAYTHFDVQRFESSKYAVVTVDIWDGTDPYGSFLGVFARRHSGPVWTSVNSIYSDRWPKDFILEEIHGFIDDDHLDMVMCVEYCDSKSNYRRVQMNVEEWIKSDAEDNREQ